MSESSFLIPYFRYMKNHQSRFWIALGIVFTTLLPLAIAEAACRPTGRYAAGKPILKCSGRTKCRPTGRIKVVKGVRYQDLRCPR